MPSLTGEVGEVLAAPRVRHTSDYGRTQNDPVGNDPFGRITPYPCFWLVATKLRVTGMVCGLSSAERMIRKSYPLIAVIAARAFDRIPKRAFPNPSLAVGWAVSANYCSQTAHRDATALNTSDRHARLVVRRELTSAKASRSVLIRSVN